MNRNDRQATSGEQGNELSVLRPDPCITYKVRNIILTFPSPSVQTLAKRREEGGEYGTPLQVRTDAFPLISVINSVPHVPPTTPTPAFVLAMRERTPPPHVHRGGRRLDLQQRKRRVSSLHTTPPIPHTRLDIMPPSSPATGLSTLTEYPPPDRRASMNVA